jgi:LysR family transcriptional regulator, glycine cleavage system transcriptional activator
MFSGYLLEYLLYLDGIGMARRLPPLNALRAFEAAARHLSFTKAADELAVTQAAISHQVKGLEDRLGVALFRRANRALVLTEVGQAYLPALRDAFDAIDAATARILQKDKAGTITVTTMPSFGAAWLVRRLGAFRALHPDIDVRLLTVERLVDFAREDVDIGIRFGVGSWPGLKAERLLTEDMFPMCSPALLKEKKLEKPEDLRHHTLLHDDMETDWRRWLVAAGVKGIDPNRGLHFTNSSMLLQAAVEGQGVALGRSALASGYLAAGQLVKPFELKLPVDAAYYVVYPAAYAQRPKVMAFRDWLMEEVAKDEAQIARIA